VIDMAFLSIIRRWALREHLSIREIARRTKLSRNTIRKYLRSDAVEPAFSVPERPSELDPFAAKLSGWLKTEAGKSRKQLAFEALKRVIGQIEARVATLDQTIETSIKDWHFGPVVDALLALRGVNTIIAATVVAEIG
jgi:transcriptional regulator with XRE-family HTH domain